MKLLICCGAVVLAVATAAAAHAPATRTNSPTLEETGAWLKEKLESLPEQVYPASSVSRFQSVKYDSVVLDGTTLKVETTTRFTMNDGTEHVVRTEERVPLRSLSPAQMSVQQVWPEKLLFRLTALTVGKQKTVALHTLASTLGPIAEPATEYRDEFTLDFVDRDTAERVTKAIAHGAELCGAKAEPF